MSDVEILTLSILAGVIIGQLLVILFYVLEDKFRKW